MIRVIFFDFGRVLMTAQDAHLYKEIDKRYKLPNGQARKWIDEFYHYGHVGEIESMAEFWPLHAIDVGKMTLTEAEIFWERVKETQEPNEPFIHFIKEHLAGKVRLCILSNFTKDLPEYIRRFHLDHIFEQVIVSANLKIKKPDQRIYQYALQSMNAVPQESLFIDDKEKNIKAAVDLGMKGVLFKDTDEAIQKIKHLLF